MHLNRASNKMSLAIGFRSQAERERAQQKYLETLASMQELENTARGALSRALNLSSSGQTLSASDATIVKVPPKNKEIYSASDARDDLAPKLRPYMFNNNEVVNFLQALNNAGTLLEFSDVFERFAQEYLVGVSRATSAQMTDLYNAFRTRRVEPEPRPAGANPADANPADANPAGVKEEKDESPVPTPISSPFVPTPPGSPSGTIPYTMPATLLTAIDTVNAIIDKYGGSSQLKQLTSKISQADKDSLNSALKVVLFDPDFNNYVGSQVETNATWKKDAIVGNVLVLRFRLERYIEKQASPAKPATNPTNPLNSPTSSTGSTTPYISPPFPSVIYTKADLNKEKKSSLQNILSGLGELVDPSDTRAKLIDKIIKAQQKPLGLPTNPVYAPATQSQLNVALENFNSMYHSGRLTSIDADDAKQLSDSVDVILKDPSIMNPPLTQKELADSIAEYTLNPQAVINKILRSLGYNVPTLLDKAKKIITPQKPVPPMKTIPTPGPPPPVSSISMAPAVLFPSMVPSPSPLSTPPPLASVAPLAPTNLAPAPLAPTYTVRTKADLDAISDVKELKSIAEEITAIVRGDPTIRMNGIEKKDPVKLRKYILEMQRKLGTGGHGVAGSMARSKYINPHDRRMLITALQQAGNNNPALNGAGVSNGRWSWWNY